MENFGLFLCDNLYVTLLNNKNIIGVKFMICKNCNIEIDDFSLFCNHCGKKIKEDELQQPYSSNKDTISITIQCPHCKSGVDYKERICPNCHKDTKKVEEKQISKNISESFEQSKENKLHTNSEDKYAKESEHIKTYICPKCKNDVEATKKFCGNCGYNFEKNNFNIKTLFSALTSFFSFFGIIGFAFPFFGAVLFEATGFDIIHHSKEFNELGTIITLAFIGFIISLIFALVSFKTSKAFLGTTIFSIIIIIVFLYIIFSSEDGALIKTGFYITLLSAIGTTITSIIGYKQ